MRIRVPHLAAALTMLATPALADIQINVDKTAQTLTVSRDGQVLHTWPVSTGRTGRFTPAGNFRAFRMEKDHYSKEFDDAPMPNSIFFTDARPCDPRLVRHQEARPAGFRRLRAAGAGKRHGAVRNGEGRRRAEDQGSAFRATSGSRSRAPLASRCTASSRQVERQVERGAAVPPQYAPGRSAPGERYAAPAPAICRAAAASSAAAATILLRRLSVARLRRLAIITAPRRSPITRSLRRRPITSSAVMRRNIINQPRYGQRLRLTSRLDRASGLPQAGGEAFDAFSGDSTWACSTSFSAAARRGGQSAGGGGGGIARSAWR